MATKTLGFAITLIIVGGVVDARTYPDLPQPETVPVTLQLETSTLTALFNAAKGFVDLVFVPFAQMQAYVRLFLTADDFVGSLSENWQPMLQAQAGAIACVVFGVLFIVVVLLGGLITCACRTCCEACGGEQMQTRKRSRSSWKNCLTLSLLVGSVLIFVPGIIVLQSNEWINTVVSDIPTQSSNLMQNGINYVDSITSQLDTVVDQFLTMSSDVLAKATDMQTLLGGQIVRNITAVQGPVLTSITNFGMNITSLTTYVETYETARLMFVAATTGYTDLLDNYKTTQATNLGTPACVLSSACIQAAGVIAILDSDLPSFTTPEDMTSRRDDLQAHKLICENVYSSMEHNITTNVGTLINNAITPTIIASTTADLETSLSATQATINSTMSSLDVFIELRTYLMDSQQTIRSFMSTYSNNYDQYRWIAGVVLGSLIMVISICFMLGLILGWFCVSARTSPTERGCLGNIGGLLLMSGAGLSVIFSWILMILVTITFLVGGASERYVCQTTESPYELLQFVDNNIPLNFSSPTTAVTSSLTSIVTSCQTNAPITTTFGLSHLVDVDDISTQLQSDTSNTTINIPVTLGTTELINNAGLQTCLTNFQTTETYSGGPISVIDGSFPSMESHIALLNAAAMQVSADLVAVIRTAASDLQGIEATLSLYRSNLEDMNTAAAAYNNMYSNTVAQHGTIATDAAAVDDKMTSDLPAIVSSSVTGFLDLLITDTTAYLDWFAQQANTNLGACLPMYTMYDGLFRFICDYFIDSLNGFWFSLGWSIFFMIPSAIIALKLAKFYRRMEATDALPPQPTSVQIAAPGAPSHMPLAQLKKSTKRNNIIPKPNNKVSPMPQ